MAIKVSLSEFTLFKDLPEELIDKVDKLCEEVNFKAGDFIFREGDSADKLHFLVDGSIVLKVNLTSRPDSITVSAVNKKHESFGWSGIVAPYHYTASAVCDTDCSIFTVNGESFMKLLEEYPSAGFIVMKRITELVASRLRTSRQALLKTL